MKILNLVHAYWPAIGGSEYLVKQVSEYLAGVGEDVGVFSTFAYNSALFTKPGTEGMSAEHGDEVINGVRVRRFPVINKWARLLYFFQYVMYRLRFFGNGFWRMLYYGPISPGMRREVEDFDGDVIVAAPFPLNHMAYPFKNKKGAAVVLVGCAHFGDRHGFHNKRIKKLVKRADGYVALTPFEKEFLVGEWGIDAEKIEVAGVGIDIRKSSGKAFEVREAAGWGKDELVIGFVGQHGLHKGIDTLIKAMPGTWETVPNARLLIAGGVTPFTPKFKELARKIDGDNCDRGGEAGSRIYFMDNLTEERKFDVLEACDIFAAPSGHESFGITVLEAWTKKKPVVGCRIPATSYLIDDGETGRLVEYKNHGELAQVLTELLRDGDLRERLGLGGFEKYKKNFTKSVIGEKYRRFYDKILHLRHN